MAALRVQVMIKLVSIFLLITYLCACVSIEHSPKLNQLVSVSNCTEFSGKYVIQNAKEESHVLVSLFGIKNNFEKITIDVKESEVEISGFTTNQESYNRVINRSRSTCSNSILTLITKDEYSGNGLFLAAEDQKLQLFSPSEGLLNIRLVSSGIYAFFIIPFYLSSDKVLNLKIIE